MQAKAIIKFSLAMMTLVAAASCAKRTAQATKKQTSTSSSATSSSPGPSSSPDYSNSYSGSSYTDTSTSTSSYSNMYGQQGYNSNSYGYGNSYSGLGSYGGYGNYNSGYGYNGYSTPRPTYYPNNGFNTPTPTNPSSFMTNNRTMVNPDGTSASARNQGAQPPADANATKLTFQLVNATQNASGPATISQTGIRNTIAAKWTDVRDANANSQATYTSYFVARNVNVLRVNFKPEIRVEYTNSQNRRCGITFSDPGPNESTPQSVVCN